MRLKCHLPKCQRGCHRAGDSNLHVPSPVAPLPSPSPCISGPPMWLLAPSQEDSDAFPSPTLPMGEQGLSHEGRPRSLSRES